MLFSALNVLYFYISTSRSMCAVSSMPLFYISLISYFPSILLRYFLNDFDMVPDGSIIIGITSALTFHMRCISIIIIIIISVFVKNTFVHIVCTI